MARNGSDGTYSLADTVAPATLADANQVMTILNDLKTAMTASIANDGQTPITGQLKGLVSANPGYSLNGDSNTGLGSDTADEIYLMCGGTKIGKFSGAGFDVLSGNLLIGGSQAIPTGTGPIPYSGSTAPTGWVLATSATPGSIGDASSGAVTRANADCLNLFTLIWNTANQSGGEGQVYDSAGSTTIRGASAAADFAAHKRIGLPDMQDRAVRGKSGSTSHGQTLGNDSVTVAQANLPAVNFTNSGITLADPTHGHGVTDTRTWATSNPVLPSGGVTAPGAGGITGAATAVQSVVVTGGGISINANSTGISVSAQGSAASGGSGTALDIKPKSLVKSFIIKL